MSALVSSVGLLSIYIVVRVFLGPSETMISTQFYAFFVLILFFRTGKLMLTMVFVHNIMEWKRVVLAVLLPILFYVPIFSQSISVASFSLDENDLTANTEGTIVLDQNGEKCALIKVETTQTGFTFDVGSLSICKTEQHPGEIWLYVPYGVNRITISHPVLGILRDHDLGMSVQRARTYILKLTTDRVVTNVIDDSQKQMLVLNVSPPNAEISISGIRETPDINGQLRKELSFGSYSYRITADKYHPVEGIITINDPINQHVLNVSLKQAFGYLSIQLVDNNSETEVFINKKKYTFPFNRIPLESGKYEVQILRPLYKPYTTTIQISDSLNTTIRPILDENFAQVTVNTTKTASIWIDNEYKGVGTWKGPLELGKHRIESRQESHTTTIKEVQINSKNAITFSCEPPKPISGGVYVLSTPSSADVQIDGKQVGKTPLLLKDVLIGEKTVRISKTGYKAEEFNLTVTEGKTTEVSKELSNYSLVKFTSDPVGAFLYINGESKGSTPQTIELVSGDYLVEVAYGGHSTYRKMLHIDASQTEKHIKLKRNYIYNNEFYISAGYRMNVMSGIDIGMGGYVGNFNLEFDYILSMKDSESIYWSENDSDNMPNEVVYQFNGITGRFGYGIRLGTRARLTPQVGINHLFLKEKETTQFYANGAYSTNGVLALKLDCVLCSHLGITISPEYSMSIMESPGYKKLSSISDTFKKYSSGFGIKLGTYIFF